MPIKKELKSSNRLVIVSTGFGNKMNMPIHEFFNKAQLSAASKLIITTNPAKRLAVNGLPPEYPSFLDLLEYLRCAVSQIAPEQLIITGVSGGGHAAILLGHLLKADYVVAFSPYTYLSSEEGKRKGDPTINRLYEMEHPCTTNIRSDAQPFLDLREVLSDWNSKTQYHLHVSRYNKWDVRRCIYLSNISNVSIHTHPYKSHEVIPKLACDQKLSQCFSFPYSKSITIHDIWLHLSVLEKVIGAGLRGPIRNTRRSAMMLLKRVKVKIHFILKRI